MKLVKTVVLALMLGVAGAAWAAGQDTKQDCCKEKHCCCKDGAACCKK